MEGGRQWRCRPGWDGCLLPRDQATLEAEGHSSWLPRPWDGSRQPCPLKAIPTSWPAPVGTLEPKNSIAGLLGTWRCWEVWLGPQAGHQKLPHEALVRPSSL